MQLIEREAWKIADNLIQELRKSEKMSSSDYKKIFNRINEVSQILESKGIYPVMIWLSYQKEKKNDSDKLITEQLYNTFKQILETNNPIMNAKEKKFIIDKNLQNFQNEKYPFDLEETIFLKKWLEKVLVFALYQAKALSKNFGGD